MPLPALNESTRFRYFTFFYLYAMQGIPAGFALTTLANYLVGQGAAPNIVGSFIAIIGTPWILQFMWGPLIDRYQYSVMGRRKQWLVGSQIGAFCTLLLLLFIKHPVQQVNAIATIFFIHSIFASFQDTSVDATAIFVVPEQERGRVNAFMRGGILIGTAIGAAVLSTILHYYNFFTAACLQSALLLVFTIVTFFTRIDKKDKLLPSFKRKKCCPMVILRKKTILLYDGCLRSCTKVLWQKKACRCMAPLHWCICASVFLFVPILTTLFMYCIGMIMMYQCCREAGATC